MRGDWREAVMGSLCSINSGESNTQDAIAEGGYAFFDRSRRIKRSRRYLYDCEALIIPGEGAEFLPRHFVGKFDLHQRAYALHNFNADIIPKYLYYYLIHAKDYWPRVAVGATVKSLRQRHFENLPVIVAPLSEQRRIAAVLEGAFEAITTVAANTERSLTSARDVFQTYLDSIFERENNEWCNAKLCEICERITDGTHQTPTYSDSGFVFLSSRNVTGGVINWNAVRYIDDRQHAEMQKRVTPRVNDILLAKNGTTGVAAIVDRDVPFDIYVSLALLRPRRDILPEFLLHFINSRVAKRQFNKRLKGVGVPNLHLEEIREVEITYPKALGEQQGIVDKINNLRQQTNRLQLSYQRKLECVTALKKSILHRAFAGELTQRHSNPLEIAAE